MPKKALALIVFSLAVDCFAAKYGGQWITIRKIGYSTEMSAIGHSDPRDGSGGSILLSQSYYTIVDSIPAGDSIYTRGTGIYYSKDSSGSDTTALALDAFVGDTVQINAYFIHASHDTLYMTIEQALSFSPPAVDSAVANGSTLRFYQGFVQTDILFEDTLNANDGTGDNDTLYCYIGGSSDFGHPSHLYSDTFVLLSPYVRIKVINYGEVAQNEPIHFELLVRQKDEVIGGASGRLQDRKTFSRFNSR